MTDKKPIILAVCGKGGVGKTSISALIVRALSREPSNRILAIDADPAAGLSFPLGIRVRKTVDDIRNELILRLGESGSESREELIRSLDYELFNALEEKDNLAFLAIGRPEGDGCYCRVNALLKNIIRDMAQNFDYVIIDAEAGIEQISRRVMEMVSHLILVSDVSLRSRTIIETIHRVAKEKCSIEKTGVIFNKIRDRQEMPSLVTDVKLPVWGMIFEDDMLHDFDREGKTFFELPEDKMVGQLDSLINTYLQLEKLPGIPIRGKTL